MYWWKGGEIPSDLRKSIDEEMEKYWEWQAENFKNAGDDESLKDFFYREFKRDESIDKEIFESMIVAAFASVYGAEIEWMSGKHTMQDDEYGGPTHMFKKSFG